MTLSIHLPNANALALHDPQFARWSPLAKKRDRSVDVGDNSRFVLCLWPQHDDGDVLVGRVCLNV
jgi:hypothetical protein